ncbi:MAG: hypothetical protein QG625_1734 [Cyanobacteriota bacterium erpe_2018_sw_39hr_WHONDRS-SW48-000098_B_bin.30]|jgi:hypothetical protein|nr:hypothetical protein [Cyanobacteriota bacterium erpe_2018_sw_39hr_WHONDRS-SW48-000098_B_bin.30]
MENSGLVCMMIVAAGIVIMPVIIIKLAKAMKTLKDKKEASADSK